MARPETKNVFYFPHYTKSTIELDLIEHKHGSEGYKTYYRLLELVADADYHQFSVATKDEKVMFDLGMNCENEVIDDVIRILIDRGRIDRQLWEDECIIWMQDFVETLKPVYANRRKPLPDKNLVSTCKNTEKSKEKESKEKESREKNVSLLSIDEYQELYPDKDVKRSMNKFMEYFDEPTHSKAIDWLEKERQKKKPFYRKTKTGLFIAYCSKCGKKHMPNNEFQIRDGSSCCRVDYVPDKPNSLT